MTVRCHDCANSFTADEMNNAGLYAYRAIHLTRCHALPAAPQKASFLSMLYARECPHFKPAMEDLDF